MTPTLADLRELLATLRDLGVSEVRFSGDMRPYEVKFAPLHVTRPVEAPSQTHEAERILLELSSLTGKR